VVEAGGGSTGKKFQRLAVENINIIVCLDISEKYSIV